MGGYDYDYTPGDYRYPPQGPGAPTPLVPYRNVSPGAASAPNYFDTSNTPGSPPRRSPRDYQAAAVPQPPEQPEQITPGGFSPTPWYRRQPPPAEPLPAIADWDHEQEHPDHLRRHIQPARYPLPNRAPDGYSQGRPTYNLRPGEQGFGQGTSTLAGIVARIESNYGQANALQPASMADKTFGQYRGFVAQYGIGPAGVDNFARAILANNPNATLGDFYSSYVLGTGNPAHTWSVDQLRQLYPSAYANLVRNGGNLSTPLASLVGGTVAGPRQQYIWPSPRPPSQWGTRGEPDWTPGRMPAAHDVGGIMAGMLPGLLLAGLGFLGGGGLGMITAYAGYQNARNKNQLQQAKDQKTYWQDALNENVSRLELESVGLRGIFGQYGAQGMNSEAAKEQLLELATKFQDQQLLNAVQSGDMRQVQAVAGERDMMFQNLDKTRAASTKADQKEAEKEAENRRNAAAWGGGVSAPTEGAPTTEGAPAAAGAAADPFTQWERQGAGMGGGAAAPAAPEGPGTGAGGGPTAPVREPQPPGRPAPEGPNDGQPQPVPGQPQQVPVTGINQGSPIDTVAAAFEMGDTDISGIPKDQQNAIRLRAAQMEQQLNQIPGSVQGRDAIVDAVRRIHPQMADALDNLLSYRMGVPSSGATSGGLGGRMTPFWQRMATLAGQADQTWNPEMFHAYARMRDDFTGQGKYAQSFGRSNRLMAAISAVLQATNNLPQDDPEESRLAAAVKQIITTGVTGDPEYAALGSAWRNFALESTAVSQGGVPPVTTAKALMDLVPLASTKRQIRAAVQADVQAAIGTIDTGLQTWAQLPENQGPTKKPPPGYIQQAYDGLNIVAGTLEPATGNMSNTYVDQQGQQKTVPMPPLLQRALPTARAAPPAAAPPAAAINQLKGNPTPEMQQHFDEIFGPGAAKRALGG